VGSQSPLWNTNPNVMCVYINAAIAPPYSMLQRPTNGTLAFVDDHLFQLDIIVMVFQYLSEKSPLNNPLHRIGLLSEAPISLVDIASEIAKYEVDQMMKPNKEAQRMGVGDVFNLINSIATKASSISKLPTTIDPTQLSQVAKAVGSSDAVQQIMQLPPKAYAWAHAGAHELGELSLARHTMNPGIVEEKIGKLYDGWKRWGVQNAVAAEKYINATAPGSPHRDASAAIGGAA
jgi:hypothetical protein